MWQVNAARTEDAGVPADQGGGRRPERPGGCPLRRACRRGGSLAVRGARCCVAACGCTSADLWDSLTRVVEGRAVPANAAVAEGKWPVLDEKLVRDEFLAGSLMPRYDAGNRLTAVVASADADTDPVAYSQELAAPRMVDLELNRPPGDQVTRLPGPREMAFSVPAELTGEDLLERAALLARGTLVEVKDPCPRRARLVVAVLGGDRDRQPGEVDAICGSFLNHPGKHP